MTTQPIQRTATGINCSRRSEPLDYAEGIALLCETTVSAYAVGWRRFRAFCDSRDTPALPAAPDALTAYLSDAAAQGIRPATWLKWCAAITHYHHGYFCTSPASVKSG